MSDFSNPYEAPQVHETQHQPLADDAEFLISAGEILCREKVELPKVCIHSGTTEDLELRQKTFQTGGLIYALLLVPLVLMIFMIPVSSIEGLILFAIAFGATRMLGKRFNLPGAGKTDVTWYINRKYFQRRRRMKQFICLAIFLGMSTLGMMLGYQNTSPGEDPIVNAISTGLPLGTVCVVFSLGLTLERTMSCSGRRLRGPHKGLYSLTGHSRKFTDVVEGIIHGGF